MESTIEFSDDGDRLNVSLVGVVDAEGVDRFNEALAADPRLRAGLSWLVDLTAAKRDPAPDVITRVRHATEVLQRDWLHPPRAIAFVVADREDAHEAEMWRAQLGGSQSRRKIFRSREEAEAWLAGYAPGS